MATKFVGNMAAPMLGALGGQPIVRMGVKLGLAYATAWGLEAALGRNVFTPAFLGGSLEVVQDAVRTFISPMIPQLAAAEYPLSIYYEAPALPARVGAYYGESDVGDYDTVS